MNLLMDIWPSHANQDESRYEYFTKPRLTKMNLLMDIWPSHVEPRWICLWIFDLAMLNQDESLFYEYFTKPR